METAQRLLKKGDTVTLLVRGDALLSDPPFAPFIDSKHCKIVRGDALVADDVAKAWSVAGEGTQTGVLTHIKLQSHFFGSIDCGITPAGYSKC